jgi:hypothetical protein
VIAISADAAAQALYEQARREAARVLEEAGETTTGYAGSIAFWEITPCSSQAASSMGRAGREEPVRSVEDCVRAGEGRGASFALTGAASRRTNDPGIEAGRGPSPC